MVHHHRHYNHQMKKGENLVKNYIIFADEESQIGSLTINGNFFKRAIRPKLLSFLFLSLLSCTLIWTPQLFGFPPTFSFLYSLGVEEMGSDMGAKLPLCSSVSNGTICCDRSSIRTDICYMKGDIRTHSISSSIFLYTQNGNEKAEKNEYQHEMIRPYTRKWETSVMDTIDELSLVSKHENSVSRHKCDVVHDVPAVLFSTGGYTGNVYHEFNDGIIPLYITSQHFNKKVVFVILEYHSWWFTKYEDILSHLTDYPPIDFSGDNRTHCFPEAIVGLNIHDELTIDQSLMRGSKSIKDFRDILDRAYWRRIRGLIEDEEREKQLMLSPSSNTLHELDDDQLYKPKLVILSRNGSREILNEDALVKLGRKIGFNVELVRPERTSELAKIYRALNSSDVMVGVHGAAMTHFLFVKPGRVFIQVVPLGTDWAAQTYYGDPATKLGLKYIGYKIQPRESSLYDHYDENDPVLTDPDSVNAKGWEYTKRIYLDKQNVKLDLRRFKKRLVHAYDYLASTRNL
ncbi:xylan glycosyltransferase MUCI21 [Amaranthus tricolor]|uniref:xylan glycosyltransferase MUCI21 n=1 Tax=Amaranthus tricolor TaxID=29722 RepID=UPI00258DE9BD|nr:xylan glycosyltransferase MUCI21 [Amaranthus tricolor]